MCHVAPVMASTFGQRFGYARWLYHLRTGDAPTNKAIAEQVGRSAPAVGAWVVAEAPPPHYITHAPLAAFFELDERWLLRGEGDPPYPELWKEWLAAREREAREPKDATPYVIAVPDQRGGKKKRAKRSSG